jgi:hypothetical protein
MLESAGKIRCEASQVQRVRTVSGGTVVGAHSRPDRLCRQASRVGRNIVRGYRQVVSRPPKLPAWNMVVLHGGSGGRPHGRNREVWMHCEPCRPEAYCIVRRRSRGEQGAKDRDSGHEGGRPLDCNEAPLTSLRRRSLHCRTGSGPGRYCTRLP